MPIILLSTESYAYPVPFVKVNDFHAAYAAAKYLIGKGHTKIGMISGKRMISSRGFRGLKALRKLFQIMAYRWVPKMLCSAGDLHFLMGSRA